jgi:methyl-accepting chemotaxis protein
VNEIIGEIGVASHEQSAGVSQAGEAISQMDQVTRQNAAMVEESLKDAVRLKQQGQQLPQAVAVCKLASSETARAPNAATTTACTGIESRIPNDLTTAIRLAFAATANPRPRTSGGRVSRPSLATPD